jgi:UDPglucose 6-dehydrogenase
MLNVAVIGTGYVGLVGGTCLSELGHSVTCVDIDEAKVQKLRAGTLPIYEPGLEEMVPRNVEAGRLTFSTDGSAAVAAADVVFIAVGTPPGEDGSADLSHVMAVAEMIGSAISDYTVVVVKSTVPIGTCDKVHEILSKNPSASFDVVSNPEFLREGVAVSDFLQPDRIVIGVASERSQEMMQRLYASLIRKGARLLVMDVRSSEMTKYASNAMLATRISFMNEIAKLCDLLGADVENVRRGMGSDKRIGPHFLMAGVGYGGSCFPKDVKALVRSAVAAGSNLQILDAVEAVNHAQKEAFGTRILNAFNGDVAGLRFGMWGLAFKPDTDDMREAPSIVIARMLTDAGATVVAYDPEAVETAQPELGGVVEFAPDAYACLEGVDALLLVTEWKLFANPNWQRVRQLMKGTRIFDGRNLWNPDSLKAQGFTYEGIGRR